MVLREAGRRGRSNKENEGGMRFGAVMRCFVGLVYSGIDVSA
jgi:hypothetical protein